MSKIEEFLKKIGVNADVIAKLNEEEANTDELVGQWKSGFKTVMANDPDFIQPIKDEIRGTELSKMEHKIKKQFNLGAEEVKDKKFDDIIQAAYEKVKNQSFPAPDELQNKIMELSKENKRLVEEVLPAKENEAKEAISQYKKTNALRSALSSKPLIVSTDIVFPALNEYLSKNYSVELDEQDKLVIKTKNGLAPLSEDGTKTITFDEVVEKHLDTIGVLKKSNGGVNPSIPGIKSPKLEKSEEAKYALPGMKAAQDNAERMKNLRTFGQ